MKKVISYLASWSLYWLGDFTYEVLDSSELMNKLTVERLFPVYNWCMFKSLDVQTWGGISNGPWGIPSDSDDVEHHDK